jgi:aminopeptidase
MNPADFERNLQKYAELIVHVGLNLRAGQRLVVIADIKTSALVRLVAAHAYQAGCRLVDVIWDDEALALIRFQHAPRDSFEEFPDWKAAAAAEYGQRGDALLAISSADPDLLAGQDAALIDIVQRTRARKNQPYAELVSRSAMNWVIAGYAGPAWAAKVFPDESPDRQVGRLWDAIFDVCRITHADPVAEWQQHIRALRQRGEYLDARRYAGLHYTGPGTDLTIGLAEGHIWKSGATRSLTGIDFVANLPTEEVFTLPNASQTHGYVTSTKPLSYLGALMEDFTLTFEDGHVVKAIAARGEDILRKLLDTDKGASRLGEAALVPHRSPISQSGVLFHNTLYDENAACHLALGRGLRFTVQDGDTLADDEFTARGGNLSNIHVDFMIGSGRIDIDGLQADGSIEPVMRQGEWAFVV